MIQSKFISDLLHLLLDGDDKGITLRSQLPFLTDIKYDYSGAGLFVIFSHSEEINNFRLTNDIILNGVKIKSSDLEIGADAILFIKEGIIDYLEIHSSDGNYPNRDLTNYILIQEWIGSPGRQVNSD